MSRRRNCFAARQSDGRIARASRPSSPELMSPTEARRLAEAASSGLRQAVWSSQIGRLYVVGKISSSQFAAAERWASLVADYAVACQAPSQPRSMMLDAVGRGGTPADPDSESGAREARRHQRATASYLDGRHALRLAGPTAERVVESVCIHDQAPAGFDEMNALRSGLSALSTWWGSSKRKPR